MERERIVPRRSPNIRVRSHTLVGIRWVGVTGQGITLLTVYYGFGFTFPIVLVALRTSTSNKGFRVDLHPREMVGSRLTASTASTT